MLVNYRIVNKPKYNYCSKDEKLFCEISSKNKLVSNKFYNFKFSKRKGTTRVKSLNHTKLVLNIEQSCVNNSIAISTFKHESSFEIISQTF